MSKFMEEALVVDQQRMALQTNRLRLHSPKIAEKARAGQFVMLQVREGVDPLLRRPFSFHRIDAGKGIVEILYRIVGRGTWWLSQCVPGTHLNVLGPLGNGFNLAKADIESPVIIAGGIGIAPLFELIVKLGESRRKSSTDQNLHLFYGARTGAEILPSEAIDQLGVNIHLSSDDGSKGYHGYVTDLFQCYVKQHALRPSSIFACGPLAMQYHVAKWSILNRVSSQLSLESLMACGLGACLGCALPAHTRTAPEVDGYLHVCKNGPIFPAESIRWNKIQPQHIQPPTFLFS